MKDYNFNCDYEKDCVNKSKSIENNTCIKCCRYHLPRPDFYQSTDIIKDFLDKAFNKRNFK